MYFVICLLLAIVYACKFEFGADISLEWTYNEDEEFDFLFKYPKSFEEDFNWAGFYYQVGDDEDSPSDGWVKTESTVYDTYSDSGELVPKSDVEQLGNEDIASSFKVDGDDYIENTWTRKSSVEEALDLALVADELYHFTVIFGFNKDDGDLQDPKIHGFVISADITLVKECEEDEETNTE